MSASISVVMPFRDAAETIDAALAGLLAQADETREVLAIDDGSTDSSVQRVCTWAARDRRVRLLTNAGSGLVSALNTGLQHARGALLARMDADDMAHPERLTRQRAHLLAHAELDVLGSEVRVFSDASDGAEVGEGLQRYVAWQNALHTPREHALARFVESPLCHPSVMLRRALIERVGGYRELSGPEDYELLLRVVAAGGAMAKLPEVLLDWRHRAGRATFRDTRYSLDGFRRVKAPYLAAQLQRSARAKVLWGAGRTGKRLARELALHGVQLTRFIDIDPHKLGSFARGLPVQTADTLEPARDLVIVAVGARGARSLIRNELEQRGFVEGETSWFAA